MAMCSFQYSPYETGGIVTYIIRTRDVFVLLNVSIYLRDTFLFVFIFTNDALLKYDARDLSLRYHYDISSGIQNFVISCNMIHEF